MESQTIADVVIDRCRACGGIWLDAMETEKLHKVASAEAADAAPTQARPTSSSKSKRICPRCGTAVMTLMVESDPPVYFETCGTCYGAFLDAGELRDVQGAPLEKWLRATIPGIFRLKFPSDG